MSKEEIKKRIEEIEQEMTLPGFWSNKDEAQKTIKELNSLKDEFSGVDPYDKGEAVLTILAGAGGDDAEDFAGMLLNMYLKFIEKKNWSYFLLHKNENDHGGYRNVTIEICAKGSYGILKNESGVHRLVRVSPFNAKQQRHTSFAMVEVIPKFEEVGDIELSDDELEVDFAKSGGPGGQNVNKRETAVRITHIPSKISVHVDSERSQGQNREKAMQLLRGKIYKALKDAKVKEKEELYVSKTTEIEWGNQIRSYVIHPYKMVKDHRTGLELRDPDSVFEGNIEEFLEAEKDFK